MLVNVDIKLLQSLFPGAAQNNNQWTYLTLNSYIPNAIPHTPIISQERSNTSQKNKNKNHKTKTKKRSGRSRNEHVAGKKLKYYSFTEIRSILQKKKLDVVFICVS